MKTLLLTRRVQALHVRSISAFSGDVRVDGQAQDADIYRIALDIAQVNPDQVIYIDDRALFVEVARGLGIRGVLHKDYETTQRAVETMGLSLAD